MARAVLRLDEVGRVAFLTLVGEGLAGLAIGVAGLGTRLGGVVGGGRQDGELGALRYNH